MNIQGKGDLSVQSKDLIFFNSEYVTEGHEQEEDSFIVGLALCETSLSSLPNFSQALTFSLVK